MKMFWFFTATTEIPMAFKMCGIFQMCCDMFLGGQYFVFGNGPPEVIKEHTEIEMGGLRGDSGLGVPNGLTMGRRTPGLDR